MIKAGSLKSDILEVIKLYGDSSCAKICTVMELTGHKIKSETISSILYKMVAERVLAEHETARGPKGGKIYTLGRKSQTKKLIFKFKI